MSGKKRGVGFCVNSDCGCFGQLRSFRHLPEAYDCTRCGAPGQIERERGIKQPGATIFDEVRVEYGFDPERRIYRDSVRVRDRRLLGKHDVYTLQSPLVKTRAQALRVAAAVMKQLNARLAKGAKPLPGRDDLISQGWPVLV